jgi:DNA-binding NarL/FixJ family response regulator
VGLLGDLPEEVRKAQELLRGLNGVEECDPATGQPDVLLCAAGSAWSTLGILDRLPSLHAPVVLRDVVMAVGPRVAALHGLFGYTTGASSAPELSSCLQRAARGRPYAPAPYDEEFQYTWRQGPLTEEERKLLDLASRGLTEAARAKAMGGGSGSSWSRSKLYRHEQNLAERLELPEHVSLPAAAVELGFHRFWPVPLPEP